MLAHSILTMRPFRKILSPSLLLTVNLFYIYCYAFYYIISEFNIFAYLSLDALCIFFLYFGHILYNILILLHTYKIIIKAAIAPRSQYLI